MSVYWTFGECLIACFQGATAATWITVTECGYTVHHVESGEAVSLEEHGVAGRGHLFCSALRPTPSAG